ncbi:hypothetical protein SAMN02744645_2367 [Stutzerimonas xanthomarina DSM 18231]|uniref:Uncharacterized protein n=1 Tax=Stutzerimonas xanthomarina DSM 18231 TaxID=1403346 RepID=A0A1M5PTJ2_9GAMM|nr:hypothetical protein SAMN02744645_2367 [Stutzerimonas xanthomarina DSM 18231]
MAPFYQKDGVSRSGCDVYSPLRSDLLDFFRGQAAVVAMSESVVKQQWAHAFAV